MEDTCPNRRHNGWSKVGADVFDKSSMRMDTTSTVRMASCSKEFNLRVTSGKGSRCSNNDCGTLVSYLQVHNHKIACPHGPCNCMEDGYVFAPSLEVLLAHLSKAHSIRLKSFRYSKIGRYTYNPLPAIDLWIVDIIGSRDDGTEFAVRFDTRQSLHIVSSVCVRSAACLSPQYLVKFWSSTVIEGRSFKNSGLCVPESIASPDGVPFDELQWLLLVPMSHLVAL